MGASTSRIDEDKALQLCRERKKFVQQALDGRCLLAAAHVSYVQSLRSTGTALRRFAETEVPVESSLYTSTSATPEQALALTEKSVSHLSYSPPLSSPPPPSSSPFQVNHMKFRGFSSKKVEEKPPVTVVATVSVTSSSSVPRSMSMEKMESSTPFEESSSTPPPWDYFGLSHPIDNQFSSPHGHVSSSVKGEDEETREVEEEEEEEDGENFSFQEREDSNCSDDEFDEPTSDTLVRSFENFNRVRQREGAESEKSKTPELSPPVTPLAAAAATPLNKTPNHSENRLPPPRDFLSSMKEVEMLFVKASETGKEVPRMLEANKLHFRPIAQSNQSGSGASSLFKTCLSCGEDPKDVPEEEAAPNTMKYLTWHRTESSRSSSSLNPLGGMNSDDVEELNTNLFENIGMIAGSHASTLDRLYAWERKLYDEVKGSQAVRREYDDKCKILRELESEGKGSKIIDKTRSVVKDLHSRIRVAIHRIDSISRRIEELRDNELQPQLEELIQGLSRMWEVMFECHKAQFQLISACHRRGNIKLNMQSELHRQVTSHLESELSALASSLTKWITGQRSYIKAIHEWLEKCVVLPRPSKRKRRAHQQPVLRNLGPPIYATCAIWLEKLEALPAKEVSSSIKALASDVARFLPRQEKKNRSKKQNDHMLRDETLEDCGPGFDRFRTSLEGFAGQLNRFAESSVEMYEELKQRIQEAKINYEQWKRACSQGN
ncbi:hypothetical protein HID58_026107 [Brassica napus]|uniref:(rape) hypothetical protein n=1 Tax=Brassica napus TaxID=3708 RepID=A0A816YLM8_BRANA|nr:protein ROLLING AND ERECT LEAF 2 [Brassica napus]XP_048592803.1 protein ROLLING AND ERECT LEAF 2 [Brassica napus]XP_048592804.1 protein ROLLING AND ERECT LEAF 2 [Brassica napus]KAH0918447.1 hypothetical protein HID58_026107 [Brassica napus]CAF2164277.1 unnamed protein product [Brassica napus]